MHFKNYKKREEGVSKKCFRLDNTNANEMK